MPTVKSGWIEGARRIPSPNSDSRPAGSDIDLLVLHAISLPRGRYGGNAIERLFTNQLDSSTHASFADLAGLRVSSHFLIRRDGALLQFVPLERRAWHAGASRWRSRERCNDQSIGVELEGVDDGPFAHAQYGRLAALMRALIVRLPLRQFAAHSDVAPGRKSDPGRGFEWPRLLAALCRT